MVMARGSWVTLLICTPWPLAQCGTQPLRSSLTLSPSVLNSWLGREELNFWLYAGLSIVTCGLFAVYYEYKTAQAINEIQESNDMRVNSELPLISLLLSLFGLSLVSLAIQQADINKFYGENPDA